MKKQFFLICIIIISELCSAQVGVNTDLPKATFDVNARTLDGSRPEGIIAPRLTGDQIKAGDAQYNFEQTGALVYATAAVTAPASFKTAGITVPGYYYFDGSTWKPISSGVNNSSVVSNCDANGFSGSFNDGVPMNSTNKYSVTIINNSLFTVSLSFSNADLLLNGVSGISVSSVSPSSVSLNAGQSQQIEYSLIGTPSSSGTLTGTWTKMSLGCVKTTSVASQTNSITSLDCSGANNVGTLTSGIPATGVSSSISYTGGNGSSHSGQTVSSTGVTGLTASLSAGSFATGSGTLTYIISGTPSSSGTASFAINIGGQSCILNRVVASSGSIIPSNITLGQNTMYTVGSVYDQDYRPYTQPLTSANTNIQPADGINESTVLDVQGVITTTGVSVVIPVLATGGGTLPAYSNTINIPAGLTQDGISRNVTLSWPSQSYNSSTTYITATIKSEGGDLLAKKLDLNAGLGNDSAGILMGAFSYPYNNSGNTSTLELRDSPGIPDKMFDVVDNSGSASSHLLLYIPVMAEDGNIWMNNNLGADYANVNKPTFNLNQQALGHLDVNAFGSLFQWGRKPDGHELINYSSSTSATRVNSGTVSTQSDVPSHPNFINPSGQDWRVTSDDTLWNNTPSGGVNNPCPNLFRVPSQSELQQLVNKINVVDRNSALNSILKLSDTGHIRNTDGVYDSNFVGLPNSKLFNSITSFITVQSRLLLISDSIVSASASGPKSIGAAIRCIKN